jgi:hypothetical protein
MNISPLISVSPRVAFMAIIKTYQTPDISVFPPFLGPWTHRPVFIILFVDHTGGTDEKRNTDHDFDSLARRMNPPADHELLIAGWDDIVKAGQVALTKYLVGCESIIYGTSCCTGYAAHHEIDPHHNFQNECFRGETTRPGDRRSAPKVPLSVSRRDIESPSRTGA